MNTSPRPNQTGEQRTDSSATSGTDPRGTALGITPEKRSRILRIVGYVLAVLALAWVLHDFHIVQALRELAGVNWKWVLVGMGFDVLSYGVQALRWKWLLHPF